MNPRKGKNIPADTIAKDKKIRHFHKSGQVRILKTECELVRPFPIFASSCQANASHNPIWPTRSSSPEFLAIRSVLLVCASWTMFRFFLAFSTQGRGVVKAFAHAELALFQPIRWQPGGDGTDQPLSNQHWMLNLSSVLTPLIKLPRQVPDYPSTDRWICPHFPSLQPGCDPPFPQLAINVPAARASVTPIMRPSSNIPWRNWLHGVFTISFQIL